MRLFFIAAVVLAGQSASAEMPIKGLFDTLLRADLDKAGLQSTLTEMGFEISNPDSGPTVEVDDPFYYYLDFELIEPDGQLWSLTCSRIGRASITRLPPYGATPLDVMMGKAEFPTLQFGNAYDNSRGGFSLGRAMSEDAVAELECIGLTVFGENKVSEDDYIGIARTRFNNVIVERGEASQTTEEQQSVRTLPPSGNGLFAGETSITARDGRVVDGVRPVWLSIIRSNGFPAPFNFVSELLPMGS